MGGTDTWSDRQTVMKTGLVCTDTSGHHARSYAVPEGTALLHRTTGMRVMPDEPHDNSATATMQWAYHDTG